MKPKFCIGDLVIPQSGWGRPSARMIGRVGEIVEVMTSKAGYNYYLVSFDTTAIYYGERRLLHAMTW